MPGQWHRLQQHLESSDSSRRELHIPARVAMATGDAQGDEIAMAPRQERPPGAGDTPPSPDAIVLINKGM